jgi:signal transduction histidine kinase
MVETLKTDGYVTDLEFDLVNKQGEIRRCITSLRLYRETEILEGSIQDITEKKILEDNIKFSNKQLHALSNRLYKIREEERLNVSRELHDNVGQALTGLKMDISWLEKKVGESKPNKELIIERFKGMKELVDESIKRVRQIASDLRPSILDTLGLLPAIEWLIQDLQQRSEINCGLNSELKELKMGLPTKLEIFRIIQESLTNVVRHSEATSVQINVIKRKKKLIFEVIDNGKGITEVALNNTTSLGLLGIRERANQINGEVTINGTSGKGSVVTLSMPYEE